MSRITLFAAPAFLLLGCSFDPFVLQARAASVCQRLPAQHFQVPTALREQYARLPQTMQHGLEVERTFSFDVKPELPPEVQAILETNFALTSVRVTTVNAEDDLGFVDSAHVRLQPHSGSGLDPRSFDYVRTEAAPRSVSWSGESFELAGYLESGTLTYSVSLVGSLPAGDVVVDLEACAKVAMKLDALEP
jgi:hypothetical protein